MRFASTKNQQFGLLMLAQSLAATEDISFPAPDNDKPCRDRARKRLVDKITAKTILVSTMRESWNPKRSSDSPSKFPGPNHGLDRFQVVIKIRHFGSTERLPINCD